MGSKDDLDMRETLWSRGKYPKSGVSWRGWRPNPSLVLLKGAIAENTVLIAILMRLAGGTHLDRQGPVTDGGGV